jgi:hypothetical protein
MTMKVLANRKNEWAGAARGGQVSEFVIISPGDFPANFRVEASLPYTPTGPEAAYLKALDESIRLLSDLSPRNEVIQSADLLKLKEDVRDRAIKILKKRAESFIGKAAGLDRDGAAQKQTLECYRIEGRYREWMARIEVTPFSVVAVPRAQHQELYCDLQISTRDVYIPPDKATLKTEIDNALNVTKTVFSEREAGVSWLYYLIGMHQLRLDTIRSRLHEYIVQLAGIAEVGLVNQDATQAPFARQDLVRYRNEFTLREAGTVKNHYVRRLGFSCTLAVLPLVVLYWISRELPPQTIMHDFRNFFVLLIGTVSGTWLSFLIRRADLTFDDLAVLEEDRLNPSIRVLFMIGLAVITGLLFWARAVIFVLGDFESSQAIYSHGAWTLLLGLLIGVAERTMGTAVGKRANDIPAAITKVEPTVTAQR